MRPRAHALAFSLSLSLSLVPALAHADGAGEAEDDPVLVQWRERFKQGLDRYEANDVAGALSYWEPLYRDLGPARGYRVGYNLARAYEVVGDVTRAAERYESFLDELKQRRKEGKPIDELVAADEAKATARLDEIARTRGRIHVAPTMPPESVRIDQSEPRLAGFVAYVAPGPHDVVFAPGSASERKVHVEARPGRVVEVALPENAVATSPLLRDATRHPFPATMLWVAGAATVLVGGGITGAAYANAVIVHDHYASQPPNIGPTQAQVADYETARTLAYASWAVPAALGLATAVLVIWYAAGTRHAKVPITTALSF